MNVGLADSFKRPDKSLWDTGTNLAAAFQRTPLVTISSCLGSPNAREIVECAISAWKFAKTALVGPAKVPCS